MLWRNKPGDGGTPGRGHATTGERSCVGIRRAARVSKLRIRGCNLKISWGSRRTGAEFESWEDPAFRACDRQGAARSAKGAGSTRTSRRRAQQRKTGPTSLWEAAWEFRNTAARWMAIWRRMLQAPGRSWKACRSHSARRRLEGVGGPWKPLDVLETAWQAFQDPCKASGGPLGVSGRSWRVLEHP